MTSTTPRLTEIYLYKKWNLWDESFAIEEGMGKQAALLYLVITVELDDIAVRAKELQSFDLSARIKIQCIFHYFYRNGNAGLFEFAKDDVGGSPGAELLAAGAHLRFFELKRLQIHPEYYSLSRINKHDRDSGGLWRPVMVRPP